MIRLTVQKAHGDYDPGTSKFFGAPTMPEKWLSDGTISENDFFFCQLRAAEYAHFDTEKLLPREGFLYFFLRNEKSTYVPTVLYCPEEPETIIDDFNAGFGEELLTDFSIDFCRCDIPENDGCALLSESETPGEVVLLRYDPLDDGLPSFLAETEKIAYFSIKCSALTENNFKEVHFNLH